MRQWLTTEPLPRGPEPPQQAASSRQCGSRSQQSPRTAPKGEHSRLEAAEANSTFFLFFCIFPFLILFLFLFFPLIFLIFVVVVWFFCFVRTCIFCFVSLYTVVRAELRVSPPANGPTAVRAPRQQAGPMSRTRGMPRVPSLGEQGDRTAGS